MKAKVRCALYLALNILLCGVAAAPSGAVVQETKNRQQLTCIRDVVYSPQFLQRYPRAPAACREVVMKDGQKWIRFEAEVLSVRGDQVTANFIDEFNRVIATLTFVADPTAPVIVNGLEMTYKSIMNGDTLSFWMAENRYGFYGSPGASDGDKLALASDSTKVR